MRDDGVLLGCGALKALSGIQGEVKSMRTATSARGSGFATALLEHLLTEATARGWRRLSLETGSQPFLAPARRLYGRRGFRACAPFADYRDDPSSVYLVALDLTRAPRRS